MENAMRAVLVRKPGGPEAMQVQALPDAQPGAGEALVEVEAAGVNFIDVYHRTGLYAQPLPFRSPTWNAWSVACMAVSLLCR